MSHSRTPPKQKQAYRSKARRPAVEYDNRIHGRDVDDDVHELAPIGVANLGVPVNDNLSVEDAEDGTSQLPEQKQCATEQGKTARKSKQGLNQRGKNVQQSQGEAQDNEGF